MNYIYPLAILTILSTAPVAAQVFQPAELITDGTRQYQLARNASNAIAFDSQGSLHITWWSGGEATTPASPSYIWYAERTRDGLVSMPVSIDDSVIGPDHAGGRHPSLVVHPNDAVHVFWHDHRHTTLAGGFIDNLEIYSDVKPSGGDFSTSDIRLTNTTAMHSGDNGYLPSPSVANDGRIHVAWYDFNAEAGISDVYVKSSDSLGTFNLSESLGDSRLTNKDDRGGAPAYTEPDLSVDSAGNRHLVWLNGTAGDLSLIYGVAAPGAPTATEEVLMADAFSFFQPPQIQVAADETIWVSCTLLETGNSSRLKLFGKTSGSSVFDLEETISSPGDADLQYPSIAIDADGTLHVSASFDDQGIYYFTYDPDAAIVSSPELVSPDTGSTWRRSAITVNASGEVYILMEEVTGLSSSDLWLATTAQPLSANHWESYR